MPEFLELKSPDEARSCWYAALEDFGLEPEEVATVHSLGRVTFDPVYAPCPLPGFTRSAVDGYAVRAADTFGASDALPVYLDIAGEVLMGSQPLFTLKPTQAALIHTGGMLPENADAVVMLEYTQPSRPGEIEVMRPVAQLENIIRAGEDVEAGQIVIPAGRRLRPVEIGGLMGLGMRSVRVARQPRIAIISSGDEVVSPEVEPRSGQVRDINSYSLAALVKESGGLPVSFGIVPDQTAGLALALDQALHECNGVLITAGSSASARDLTAKVIHDAGQPGILAHGINVRPGKPTILAVCEGKPVVGLPGNPVSALIIAWLFVQPLIERMQRLQLKSPRAQVMARLTINLPSLAGREDWIPVSLISDGTGFKAAPIFFKSNLIFNLVRADGLLYIPADATGLSAGELVQVYLL